VLFDGSMLLVLLLWLYDGSMQLVLLLLALKARK
jgi:hypothetical protein